MSIDWNQACDAVELKFIETFGKNIQFTRSHFGVVRFEYRNGDLWVLTAAHRNNPQKYEYNRIHTAFDETNFEFFMTCIEKFYEFGLEVASMKGTVDPNASSRLNSFLQR